MKYVSSYNGVDQNGNFVSDTRVKFDPEARLKRLHKGTLQVLGIFNANLAFSGNGDYMTLKRNRVVITRPVFYLSDNRLNASRCC